MVSDLFYRLRALFKRSALERELDQELAAHIERQTEKYIKTGLPRHEALRQAQIDLGGIERIKEECRESRGVNLLDEARRNIRYTFRTLTKNRGFTVVAVLTLALAIGANSAVFSAINAILLRPLPFPDGDQLMLLEQISTRQERGSIPMVAPLRLADWNRMNTTFQIVAGYLTEDVSEVSGAIPEKLTRAWVSPRFFQIWGVAPSLGRFFAADEERLGGPPVAVLSDRLWRSRFGADPNAIGKQLHIENSSFTIVGVMPPSFLFENREVDIWSPVSLDVPYGQSRDLTWFRTVGRLKAGVDLRQAQSDLSRVQTELGRQYPQTDGHLTVRVRPLKEVTVGNVRGSLWILFGSVSLLLLLACTNIAALLVAHTAGREREISVRLSLGASRATIIGQLLTEAFTLAISGAALGLLFATAAASVFRSLAGGMPRVEEIRLDWTLVLYSLVCSVGATICCGLLPAIRSTRSALARSLARTARTQVSVRNRLQWLLAGVQVALAVTLLVGAGLLLRSFQELGRVSPGFDASRVLTFRISANWGETGNMPAFNRRIDQILESLRATPGIEGAATSLTVPGVPGQFGADFRVVEGSLNPDQKTRATSRFVSAGYFNAMGIPLVAGEPCPAGDGPPRAVVNQSFVDTYLGTASAVGRHLDVPGNPRVLPTEIRGVAADAREQGLYTAPAPVVYTCVSAPVPSPVFIVRTHAAPASMVETLRKKIHEIEPRRSMYEVMPLEERLDATFAENRLRTVLLTFFAATAVSLACIGLYGTLSYFVNLRRREVGLRIALGALRPQILSQFLWQGLRVSLIGCAAGFALAAAFGRALSGMLYGISSLDPLTFAGVLVLVFCTGIVASLAPAARAARVDPNQVLRDE